jgi:hypothetical protein
VLTPSPQDGSEGLFSYARASFPGATAHAAGA